MKSYKEMSYGDYATLMMKNGRCFEEIINDAEYARLQKEHAEIVKRAKQTKNLEDYRVDTEVLAMKFSAFLMTKHGDAMSRIICQTEGITMDELKALNADETIAKFTKTFNEVLAPFFTLCATMV